MAQLGADVDQLDDLSQRFKTAAQQLNEIMNQIGGKVDGAWWQGGDADKFRAEWQGTFRTQLQNVCTAFEQTGTQVKTQSDQQRQASA